MDAIALLQNLSAQMEFEPASDGMIPGVSERKQRALCVTDAQLPNGKRITLIKTLLTSACERNCYYCPFRSGRDFQRATLKPEEMASAFMAFYRAGIARGMFLSSGVAGGGVRTQDQLLATGEILRKKYQFRGYLHLKLMPGAEQAQVEAAMRIADRVSINLEAPNSERLHRLAPGKVFMEELMQPMKWVAEIRANQPASLGWKGRWPSITTQFVVGAVGESDLELLSTTNYLNKNISLNRAYYSIFRPVTDTPFEELPPAPQIRENHLYQASFLLRDYGFDLKELPFDDAGHLPEKLDPKLAWANQHLAEKPVEINSANRGELMRIPGIGPKSADMIIAARRQAKITCVEDLKQLGIRASHSSAFILLDGKRPDQQLVFW
jgi:predicted DNA-binding helix-hairpin-helix protein